MKNAIIAALAAALAITGALAIVSAHNDNGSVEVPVYVRAVPA